MALERYFSIEQAAIWPEVEAQISEGGWIHDNLDARIPRKWGPHALYLANARNRMVADGRLIELPALVGGLPVSAWANPALLNARGRSTAVRRLAATKRRIYRRFLVWTGDARLCGNIAEGLVDRTIRSLHGTNLWLPPGTRSGHVDALLGRPLEIGGPLDAAGLWARNPNNPNDGFIPFGAEVKNIRSPIYPWSAETWDLLAKLAAFPDVVPVLVARRINSTTFRFFKDIGALGTELRNQLFSDAVDPDDFERVTNALKLHNAVRVRADYSMAGVTKFFRTIGPEFGQAALERWAVAAPIAATYPELRRGGDRMAWTEFCREIIGAGLYTLGGWAPAAASEEPDLEPDDDWWDD